MDFSKNKIAGIERPYTFSEFLTIIEKIAKEKKVPCINELEYFSAEGSWWLQNDQKFVDDYDIDIVSETHFGGSEGIYTRFYIWNKGQKIDFACAKNLDESEKAFIDMHIFAAKVCLIARKYAWQHQENFNWSGYDVGCIEDGKFIVRVICCRLENAQRNAEEFKKNGIKTFIRDNSTRKMTEYK